MLHWLISNDLVSWLLFTHLKKKRASPNSRHFSFMFCIILYDKVFLTQNTSLKIIHHSFPTPPRYERPSVLILIFLVCFPTKFQTLLDIEFPALPCLLQLSSLYHKLNHLCTSPATSVICNTYLWFLEPFNFFFKSWINVVVYTKFNLWKFHFKICGLFFWDVAEIPERIYVHTEEQIPKLLTHFTWLHHHKNLECAILVGNFTVRFHT